MVCARVCTRTSDLSLLLPKLVQDIFSVVRSRIQICICKASLKKKKILLLISLCDQYSVFGSARCRQ